MRQNKTKLPGIFGDSGYSSPFLSYGALYILATVELLAILHICSWGFFTPDSDSYIDASYCVAHGEIHSMRTPVLPLVMALMRSIAGECHQVAALVIFQSAVFLISVGFFRIIAARLLRSARATFWLTAFYALWPAFPGLSAFVIAESLTLSCVVFFTWALFRRYPGMPGASDAFISGLLLVVLILLRPQMLCLVPVYLIYWCAICLKWKRRAINQALVSVLMLAVCAVTLLAYKAEAERRFGIKSITTVSAINNYYTAREAGLMTPDKTENPRLKLFLDSIKDIDTPARGASNDEFTYIRDSIGVSVPEVEEAVNKAISSRPAALARVFVHRVSCASRYPLFYYPTAPYIILIYTLVPVTLWPCMVFMCMAFVWLVWRRRGLVPWTLWLISAAIYGSSIVGAMAGWNRLFAPGIPEAFILLAVILLPVYQTWKRGKASAKS